MQEFVQQSNTQNLIHKVKHSKVVSIIIALFIAFSLLYLTGLREASAYKYSLLLSDSNPNTKILLTKALKDGILTDNEATYISLSGFNYTLSQLDKSYKIEKAEKLTKFYSTQH